jgi:hypothetical protein
VLRLSEYADSLVRSPQVEDSQEHFRQFIRMTAAHFGHLRLIQLPTAFHRKLSLDALPLSNLGRISSFIVEVFVGFIFTMVPYISAVFLIRKTWQLNQNIYILIWNLICVVIMVSVMITAILVTKRRRGLPEGAALINPPGF